MSDYQIRTVESRRFDIVGGVAPFEVEFHKQLPWAAELESIPSVSGEPLADGLALARYSVRIALTGSALPPITIMIGPGEPAPLAPADLHDLAFLIASFGPMPSEVDYSDASRYLLLRAAIEERLGLTHIHLGLRGGRRQRELEDAIEQIAPTLADYSLAFAQSPEIGLLKFAELIQRGGRIFTFSGGADRLLGGAAVVSAYQLATGAPVLAIQLAAGGAAAYVVLKFGHAVGRKVEQLIEKW